MVAHFFPPERARGCRAQVKVRNVLYSWEGHLSFTSFSFKINGAVPNDLWSEPAAAFIGGTSNGCDSSSFTYSSVFPGSLSGWCSSLGFKRAHSRSQTCTQTPHHAFPLEITRQGVLRVYTCICVCPCLCHQFLGGKWSQWCVSGRLISPTAAHAPI